MKRVKKTIVWLLLLCSLVFFTGCGKIRINPGPFDEYTASIFKTLVNDEMSLNFLFEDRTTFGLDYVEPSLPTPSTSSEFGRLLINLYFGSMSYYNYDELNDDEQITYLLVKDLLENYNAKKPGMDYLASDYLGSYLGYQAQLPLLLAEYHFWTLKDIENYFAYMDLVEETFKAYVDFEIEKANNGFGMPDFVIDKVIAQCETFLSDLDNHFLIQIFPSKIENLVFLTEDQKAALIQTNEEKVKESLAKGYEYIKENLGQVRGLATNNLGLAHYELGKDYYTLLFKDETGYDIPIEEAIAYIDQIISDRIARIIELYRINPNIGEEADELKLMESTPEGYLAFFREKLAGHFPILPYSPEIEVKYISPVMEDFFSPAAYMISPIDSMAKESIYLNNKKVIQYETTDKNYLYTTLAHEGFPGHLYQNIYFKGQETNPIRKVLKSSGYVEGWATYAQMYSYQFIDGVDPLLLEFLKLNDELNGAINCRIEMGINYEGWDFQALKDYLIEFNPNIKDENVQKALEQLIEVPTNPQIYYFTYFKLADLYEEIKTALGTAFAPVTFHQAILDCGPLPLRYVEERVRKALLN